MALTAVQLDLYRRHGAAFGESLHGFLDFLASERRASRHTVSAYRRDLAQLSAFMIEKRGSELPAHKIDVFLLRQWLGAMARVVAPPSVARKISAIKAFFRYLHHRGLIEKDPASDLASPKVRRPLPTFLGVDAAREVMESSDGLEPVGKRDRAVLEVLYGSGLRVSELSNLDLGDIDLKQGSVRVVGKGNKERVVPLGRAAVASLEAYLEVRILASERYVGRPQGTLSVGSRGAPRRSAGAALGASLRSSRRGPRRSPPPRAPSYVRDAHARGGRRSARHSRDARPREPRHHAALHARLARSADEGVRWRAPAGQTRSKPLSTSSFKPT